MLNKQSLQKDHSHKEKPGIIILGNNLSIPITVLKTLILFERIIMPLAGNNQWKNI